MNDPRYTVKKDFTYTPKPINEGATAKEIEKNILGCPVFGIFSFPHFHAKGTLPKDFERISEQKNEKTIVTNKFGKTELSINKPQSIDTPTPEEKKKCICICHMEELTGDGPPVHSALVNLPCPHCEDKTFQRKIYAGKDQKIYPSPLTPDKLAEAREMIEQYKGWKEEKLISPQPIETSIFWIDALVNAVDLVSRAEQKERDAKICIELQEDYKENPRACADMGCLKAERNNGLYEAQQKIFNS